MRALVWITEGSWTACVERARQLLPADAEVTILHVAARDVESLAEHPGPGRLGRRHRSRAGQRPEQVLAGLHEVAQGGRFGDRQFLPRAGLVDRRWR